MNFILTLDRVPKRGPGRGGRLAGPGWQGWHRDKGRMWAAANSNGQPQGAPESDWPLLASPETRGGAASAAPCLGRWSHNNMTDAECLASLPGRQLAGPLEGRRPSSSAVVFPLPCPQLHASLPKCQQVLAWPVPLGRPFLHDKLPWDGMLSCVLVTPQPFWLIPVCP